MQILALSRRARTLVAALALALAPRAVVHAAQTTPSDEPAPVRVTAVEVDASNREIAAAYADLAAMWSAQFDSLGRRFAVPGIARYRSPVRTACGVMDRDNAAYCVSDNTIYYDDVFVAAVGKRAAAALHTDGDMAALGVIAHEMGHAVAMELGYASPYSYDNEAVADCLAGVFAKHAAATGALEAGDLDEAFFGMASAGDPDVALTGNVRLDRRILARRALVGHGTRDQRMSNFKRGLDGGPGSCVADFQRRS